MSGDGARLEGDAAFPIEAEAHGHAAAPSLEYAAYTTADALICVDRDGTPRWRSEFGAAPKRYMNGRASCAFSTDGTVVWLYRPDMAMKGSGHFDQWLAFDAATGAVLGQEELGSGGHGAQHHVHPNGKDVLLNVGEGQEGSRVFRGSVVDGGISVVEYAWDGDLCDLSPDGGRMMTVREKRGTLVEELVFRTFPEGREEVTVPAEAFGYDEDRHETFFIGWIMDYLDGETAIVSVRGEYAEPDEPDEPDADELEEQEFHHNYLVDAENGRVIGPLAAEFFEREDIIPLGDGSWLTTGGGLHRHARPAR